MHVYCFIILFVIVTLYHTEGHPFFAAPIVPQSFSTAFRQQIQSTGGALFSTMNKSSSPSTTINAAASNSTSTTPAAAAPTTSFPRTFYRRQLPSSSISFSSPEGRTVFASAMANGGTFTFFPLIEQLWVYLRLIEQFLQLSSSYTYFDTIWGRQTRSEPAYCGLTTLVIVLNGEYSLQ